MGFVKTTVPMTVHHKHFIFLFTDSKKEYLLLAHVPTALSGGWAVWMLAMNAFVADITAPDDRAFRYGMLHLGP